MKHLITILLCHLSLNMFAPVIVLDRLDFSLNEMIEKEAGVTIPEWVDQEHIRLMYNEAVKHDVPIRIMFRLVYAESSFIHDAVSPKKAYGYMQIIPSTYAYLLDKLSMPACTPHTPELNIKLGVGYLYYLREIMLKNGYAGWDVTLASYNAGVGRVLRKGGIPDIPETIKYVTFINQ